MKALIALSFLLSFTAQADFGSEHSGLCSSPEVKKLMGAKGSCQIMLAPTKTKEVSGRCVGKLADISCRVMVLKTSDVASMTLICGDMDSPLLSQVLAADVLSYQTSAIVKTSSGEYVTLNDPREFHLLSNPALEVQLVRGDKIEGKMVLSLQERSIELKDVSCE